ncbi:MAG: hypothetical protein KBT19_00690 [Lachnospiraceae bacterium]|nr:hypothetical protein [Candidatus Colinaster equi]
MNEHIELLVASKASVGIKLLKILLILIAGLAVVLLLLTGSFIALLAAIAAGAGAYFISQRQDIEYEYTLTMNELDIDVVYNKQSRKHLVTLDLSKMEICAPIKSYHLDDYKNRTLKCVDYSSRNPENDANKYALIYSGEVKYIIEPDTRLVEAFWNNAPRKVFKE